MPYAEQILIIIGTGNGLPLIQYCAITSKNDHTSTAPQLETAVKQLGAVVLW